MGFDPQLLEGLNPYSIEGRYPGLFEPIGREEALRAVDAAKAIRRAIREITPPEL